MKRMCEKMKNSVWLTGLLMEKRDRIFREIMHIAQKILKGKQE